MVDPTSPVILDQDPENMSIGDRVVTVVEKSNSLRKGDVGTIHALNPDSTFTIRFEGFQWRMHRHEFTQDMRIGKGGSVAPKATQQLSNKIALDEEVPRIVQVATKLESIYAERHSRLFLAFTFDAWAQVRSVANSAKRLAEAEGKTHDLYSKLFFRGREIAHFWANRNNLRLLRFRIFIAWRRQAGGKSRYIDTMSRRFVKDSTSELLSGAFLLWLRSTIESHRHNVFMAADSNTKCNGESFTERRTPSMTAIARIHEVIAAHSTEKVKLNCCGIEHRVGLLLARILTVWFFVARESRLVNGKVQRYVNSCDQTAPLTLAFLMWLHLCECAKQIAVMDMLLLDVTARLDKVQIVHETASSVTKHSIEMLTVQQHLRAWRETTNQHRSYRHEKFAYSANALRRVLQLSSLFDAWLRVHLYDRWNATFKVSTQRAYERGCAKEARKLRRVINETSLYHRLSVIVSAWRCKACVESRILHRFGLALRRCVSEKTLLILFRSWLNGCIVSRCDCKVAVAFEMRLLQEQKMSRELSSERKEMAKYLAERWLQLLQFQVFISWQYHVKEACTIAAQREALSRSKMMLLVTLIRVFLYWRMVSQDAKRRLSRRLLAESGNQLERYNRFAYELQDRLCLSSVFLRWWRQVSDSYNSYCLRNLKLLVTAYKKQAATATHKPLYILARDVIVLWRCLVFGQFNQVVISE